MKTFEKMNFFRDRSPTTPSGTSSSDGKLDEDDDIDTIDGYESQNRNHKTDRVSEDDADVARMEEEQRQKQMDRMETWDRTVPGSGMVLFLWYIVVSEHDTFLYLFDALALEIDR